MGSDTKPTRRRLASVESEIMRIVDHVVPLEARGTWEVVREHEATSRSQLAGWGIEGQAEAERLAATLNARVEAMGGLTLASSGLLERGWVYSSRRSSS